jgi:phosphoribosylformylglycinamidine synthase
VACLGIVKKENIIYGNALNEGSLLVLCGAKTGNEGVDSAVMASKHLTEEKEGNIQKADAYLENLLLDAFVELSDKGLAEGCQDLGAGGILCATTEVIKRGREKTKKNLGCEIYLDQIPLKSELDNYSILASETQERMLLVSSRGNYSEIRKILRKWGLEHKVIGDVNNTGCYDVYTGPKVPYNNPDNNTSRFTKNELIYTEYFTNFKEEDNHLPLSYNDNHNTIDKIKDSSLWETYDHTIGARTIKGPDQPGSYSILDLYEINKKLVITWGNNVESCHSKLKELDASPLGVVNCLNFGDPLTCIGDFKNHIDLMNEQCKELKIPVLGGNVSMYNTTDGVDIPSSVVIVMIGLQEHD